MVETSKKIKIAISLSKDVGSAEILIGPMIYD